MAIWKGSRNPSSWGQQRSSWLLTTYPSVLGAQAATPYLKQLDLGVELPSENLEYSNSLCELDVALILGVPRKFRGNLGWWNIIIWLCEFQGGYYTITYTLLSHLLRWFVLCLFFLGQNSGKSWSPEWAAERKANQTAFFRRMYGCFQT